MQESHYINFNTLTTKFINGKFRKFVNRLVLIHIRYSLINLKLNVYIIKFDQVNKIVFHHYCKDKLNATSNRMPLRQKQYKLAFIRVRSQKDDIIEYKTKFLPEAKYIMDL